MSTIALASPPATTTPTPMLRQYIDMKAAHADCVVLFRMGDFYEVFYDDAPLVAKVLGIQLTSRADVPMCGIPWHQLDGYLPLLIEAGHKVALCEQLESPEQARKERGYKALVKREVVRVVTAGTLCEESLLDPAKPNYLAAIAMQKGDVAVALVEMSTADVLVDVTTITSVPSLLAQYEPAEILIDDVLQQHAALFEVWQAYKQRLTLQPNSAFHLGNAHKRMQRVYNVESVDVFGDFAPVAVMALGAALDYAALTQKGQMPSFKPPRLASTQHVMQIDGNTRRHLELVQGASGKAQGSLLAVLDKTLTPMGGRRLRQQLAAPLCDAKEINQRLDTVAFWLEHGTLRQAVRENLRTMMDMERSLTRLSLQRGGPRDLVAIRRGLEQAERVQVQLKPLTLPSLLQEAWQGLPAFLPLTDRLSRALQDDVPFLVRDGDFIAPRFSVKLDELRVLAKDSVRVVRDLEQQYQRTASISTLRIKHNNVLGYFIEVNPKHADALKEPFIHRQTLANVMRFTTPELASLQTKIIEAESQALALEKDLFEQLTHDCLAQVDVIRAACDAIAVIDVSAALAAVAHEYGYCRPTITNTTVFRVEGGRHPMVEAALPVGSRFTANDCMLQHDEQLWLLTGPNMAGKSTFLRQNALMAIMAQMGSYVPASSAQIGIVDKVFTRIGAADDVAQGRSTFMVEMLETAAIVHQATSRSLVILDEIGRGTATYDGLAIAWAVFEYLHDTRQCRTLFATHYHELTTLAEQLARATNYTVSVKEWEKSIIFLHKVIKGKADRSYGVHVAKMAGMPPSLIKRAESLLTHFEQTGVTQRTADLPLFDDATPPLPEKTAEPAVITRLKDTDVDALSPREALALLYDLKASV